MFPVTTSKPNWIDARFFELAHKHFHEGIGYEGYVTKFPRSTMVLFSQESETPLAALILSSPDKDVSSLITARAPLTPFSTEAYFQGMLSVPNSVLHWTMVNLLPEGHLNFNILHTPHRVSEVDPGPSYGINEVNELAPNKGYTVPVDQRTGRQMVLQGLTRPTEGGEEQVSVGMAEENPATPQGLYFHLSVIPSSGCAAAVAKFAEGTTWKCVDYFVRSLQYPPRRPYQPEPLPTFAPQPFSERCPVWYQDELLSDLSNGELARLDPDAHGTVLLPPSPRSDSSSSWVGFGPRASAFRSAPPVVRFGVAANLNNFSFGVSPQSASATFAPVNVSATQAGKLGSGAERKVDSTVSHLSYAYDHPSAPTVVCLSLCPGMTFLPLPDLASLVKAQVATLLDQGRLQVLQSLPRVFISERCVLDLTSPPDTVVCQCGHQCLHSSSLQGHQLTHCPLCREPISALIQVQALLPS